VKDQASVVVDLDDPPCSDDLTEAIRIANIINSEEGNE